MQTEDKLKVHVEAEIIRLRSGAEITQEKY